MRNSLETHSSLGRWGALTSTSCLVFLGCFLGGCSGPAPKPADAEQVARARIVAESEGRIAVAEFKTRGSAPDGTAGKYRWSYEAELEFVQDCKWLTDSTGRNPLDFRTAPPEDPQAGRTMRQGDHWRVFGVVNLEKAKDGWKPGAVTIAGNGPRR